MKSAGYILPLVCAALFLTAYRSTAQPSLYANPFIEQIEHYPQEKLHVSTDKDSYIAGDTIWLRAHCADAATDRKSTRLNSSHYQQSRMPSSA